MIQLDFLLDGKSETKTYKQGEAYPNPTPLIEPKQGDVSFIPGLNPESRVVVKYRNEEWEDAPGHRAADYYWGIGSFFSRSLNSWIQGGETMIQLDFFLKDDKRPPEVKYKTGVWYPNPIRGIDPTEENDWMAVPPGVNRNDCVLVKDESGRYVVQLTYSGKEPNPASAWVWGNRLKETGRPDIAQFMIVNRYDST